MNDLAVSAPSTAMVKLPNKDEARTAIRNLAREMTRRLIARRNEIFGIMCAAVARQHVCLLGDPGTAKSMLARLFATGLGFDSARRDDGYFEMLLSKSTKDQEVLGPFSLEGIKQDRWERKLDGRLGSAQVAFLDEIFKCNSVLLNSLLGVMNERVIYQESGATKVPLQILIGASNEIPGDDDGLAPFWDRFALRYWVKPVGTDPKGFAALKQLARELESGAIGPMKQCATLNDFAVANAELAKIPVPPEVDDAIFKITKELADQGIFVSDRKQVLVDSLIRASAYINGNAAVKPDDLKMLMAVLWDTRDQIDKVKDAVQKYAKDPLDDAKRQVAAVLEKTVQAEANWEKIGDKGQVRAMSEIDVAIAGIKKNQASSEDSEEMQTLLASLVGARERVKARIAESKLAF